jgi:hypothetical protein
MGKQREALPGVAILILYLALAVGYNFVAPPFESPDEVGHFFTVKYIADHGRLPVPEKTLSEQYLYGQEGTQPPLYYLGGAWILRISGVNTEDAWGYLRVNPHTTCGSPQLVGNKPFLAHDPARETFPWRDSILALHLLRFYSTALGLATVIGVYATARLCFPDRPMVAPLATALTALNPQFLFVSAGVNNDNLVVLLCVWSLYLVLHAIHHGLNPTTSVLTGLLIGLAALSKTAGLLLLPLACLAILLAVWLQRRCSPWSRFLPLVIRASPRHWSLVILSALVVAGWWYVRNALLYADPMLLEHHLAIVSRREPTPLSLILHEVPSIFYSYWGRFSCDLSPGGWYYAFWGLVTLAGLGGLIVGWRRFTVRQRTGLFLLAVWFLLVFAGWFRWNLIASGVQGRLLFPATVSVSVLVGGGLAAPWAAAAWMQRQDMPKGRLLSLVSGVSPRHWSLVIALLVLAWIALVLWVPLGLIRPAYAPPPRYPGIEGLEIPHRIDGIFGDRVALLGYDLRPADLEAGQTLDLTLYLSALRPLTDTYSMGLWLVSAIPGDTTRLAGLDTWPGSGSYPTSAWQLGEVTVDTYRLVIPNRVPRAQAWMVQVNFYHMEEGKWFSITQNGQVMGDRAILEWVRVGASEPSEMPPEARLESLPVFGEAVALPGALIAPEEHGLRVTLWWEALAPLERDYTVFVHLVDGEGRLVGTGDGPPLEGGFPTRLWRSGDSLADEHVIPFPPDLSPGAYTVQVGWYDPVTGVRLSVDGNDYFELEGVIHVP